MTTSHWQRPHSFQSQDMVTDIVIIGGGLIGLSTAFWLSEMDPALKITIVDRGSCGSGASGRNAGFLTRGSAVFFNNLIQKWGKEKAKQLYSFADQSLSLIEKEVLKSSPEIKFERTSSLTLMKEGSEVSGLEDFGFRLLGNNDLPLPLASSFTCGLESETEFKVNPKELLGSLKKMLESRKVNFLENASAFRLVPEGIQTEINTIRASKVILALNGYLPEFHPSFIGSVIPRRAQMLAVEFSGALPCPHLYYDPSEKVYWRKTQENQLIIGGKRLLDEKGETGDFEKLSSSIQDGLETYVSEVLGLEYKVIHRWSGIMGFTEHELPLLQKINAPIETYLAAGFSGHGMGFGFHSGKELAELSLNKKSVSFFEDFKKVEVIL